MSMETEGRRIYAIGDVHGHLALLEDVHRRIAADLARRPSADHVVIHIGDLVDRGPDSRGVIEFMLAGAARGAPWVTLLGNHDRMFRGWLIGPEAGEPRLIAADDWLDSDMGGRETLRSYGLEAPEALPIAEARAVVPAAHADFLARMPLRLRIGGYFFAHAGVRPGAPLDEQSEDDLVWIREPFLSSKADHGAVVVHGHTPVREVEHRGNRLAIDTGAAFGGPLSCVVLEGRSARLLDGPALMARGD